MSRKRQIDTLISWLDKAITQEFIRVSLLYINNRTKENLQKFPGEYVSVSVSDPRPTVRFFLSFLPTVMAGLNSVSNFTGVSLDVSLLPNAQEVTQHLFPNVSITTDDGANLRMETRASLALPF